MCIDHICLHCPSATCLRYQTPNQVELVANRYVPTPPKQDCKHLDASPEYVDVDVYVYLGMVTMLLRGGYV